MDMRFIAQVQDHVQWLDFCDNVEGTDSAVKASTLTM
jgi:hypothetical protein